MCNFIATCVVFIYLLVFTIFVTYIKDQCNTVCRANIMLTFRVYKYGESTLKSMWGLIKE